MRRLGDTRMIDSHCEVRPLWVGDGAFVVDVDVVGLVVDLTVEVEVVLVVVVIAAGSGSAQYSRPATTPGEHPGPIVLVL